MRLPISWQIGLGSPHSPYGLADADDCLIAQDMSKEDAAEVVRRVNCHDELLAAAQDMRDALNAIGQQTSTFDSIIAKAEAKP